MIISLYAKGLSVSDIKNHLEKLYGYELSEQTISNITNAVYEKAKIWQKCALEQIYAVLFIDATVLKVRIDNAVKNIAAYLILGIKLDGTKEILGIYISKDSESSIFWLDIFNEIKNRSVSDILIVCTDNLSGISKAINGSFPTIESVYKSLFLVVIEIQSKWNGSKIRDWDKIYPQLTIYFSEILEKYE